MSTYIVIGFLDGEITDTFTTWVTSEDIEKHFPIGDVYRYAEEPAGFMWRVLQRGTAWKTLGNDSRTRMSPQLLPIKAEDVPEIVRMVALMRE